jgi:hypothetical protein
LTKKVNTPKLLNIAQYAAHCGVTRQTIAGMIARGQIKVAQRKGRQKFLNVQDADRARAQTRLRFRLDPRVDETFLAVYAEKLKFQRELSAFRLARATGDVLDKAAALERFENIGRAIRKRLDDLTNHAEDLTDILRARGREAMREHWIKCAREAGADIEAMLAAACGTP